MALRLLTVVSFGTLVSAVNYKNPTPPMGWNSYNYYSCSPNEDIIKSNAQGLVDLGFSKLGYTYVTPDCGWPAADRDSNGRLQFNPDLFPSGGASLGAYLHGLGLKFGLYSGGGYLQCGSDTLPASLGNEEIDAQTFSDWGGDSLKYDNCWVSKDTMVEYDTAESTSPTRFQTMAKALESVDRSMAYLICQWGVGEDIGTWASAIGNTWRISNDIYNSWKSIWRITNEVVPYYKHTGVGAFADMDMLIVGLGALSYEEERFHFGMWAINKSPLTIGAPMNASITTAESLSILRNEEVIAINQDSLAEQAQLIRRFTEEEYDIWAGNLSGSRMVVAVANWKNDSQTVSLNLDVLGVASATARDVWAAKDLGTIKDSYTAELAGHELKILVLSSITKSGAEATSIGYYTATDATLSGIATVVSCNSTQCLPAHSKVGDIKADGSTKVTFSGVDANVGGTKLLGIDFINYDVALDTAWTTGTNTRNMSIAVNGGDAKRWAFPISGGDWYDSGRLFVYVDGFNKGANEVVFTAPTATWAPDLVGFEVFE